MNIISLLERTIVYPLIKNIYVIIKIFLQTFFIVENIFLLNTSFIYIYTFGNKKIMLKIFILLILILYKFIYI